MVGNLADPYNGTGFPQLCSFTRRENGSLPALSGSKPSEKNAGTGILHPVPTQFGCLPMEQKSQIGFPVSVPFCSTIHNFLDPSPFEDRIRNPAAPEQKGTVHAGS